MFDGYIRDHARWGPRAIAAFLPGRQVSYAAFDAEIDRLGQALMALGLTPGDGRVVSVAIAEPYYQYLATAALCRLNLASAAAADDAADLRLSDDAPPIYAPAGPLTHHLTAAWFLAALAADAGPLPTLPRDPQALGRVMLSSGTTRTPRRVALSWRRLELGNHATLHEYCHGMHGVWIPLVGIDSMMGLALVMGAWSVGAAAANAVPLADLPARLETLPGGVLSLTPSQLRQLLASLPSGFEPQPRWRIICGGSLLPPAVAREARLRLTPDIRLLYGATEIGTLALGHAADLEHDPGQIGITPSDAIVEIVDEAGRPVPEGQSGEIRARGPRLAHGYLGDLAATAEQFRDGWFHTGDIGRRLPPEHPLPGRIVLEGRADDRMNLGGFKVMPGPLEAAGLDCPGVRDAAAFAVPDAGGLDQCWLAIVADPGFAREALIAHLAGYPDLPRANFAWTDEIPRNAMGKAERLRLRAAVLAATQGA